VRDGTPGWLAIVAADLAARGRVDDALVRTATATQVGLVTIDDEGRVWWSDETYFLHGRPRWRRVRTVDDLAWGARDPGAVRRAYIATLDQQDVELRYQALGAAGETRDLVLRSLGRGIAAVHRAGVGRPQTAVDPQPPVQAPVEPAPARIIVAPPVVAPPVVAAPETVPTSPAAPATTTPPARAGRGHRARPRRATSHGGQDFDRGYPQ